MIGDDSKHSSKHKRSGERDRHKSKKRHKSHRDESGKRRDKKEETSTTILDVDGNDDDMWVEKNIDMDGERVRMSFVLLCKLMCLRCSLCCPLDSIWLWTSPLQSH